MGKRLVTPDADAFEKAHFTVIQQLHLITLFANEHKGQLREDNPNCGRAWLAKMHMQGSAGGSEIMSKHAAIMLY
jgi:hypothetical protein